MKLTSILLSTAALLPMSISVYAADLPSRYAPAVAPPPPIFTWTGFYAGGQIGYQWTTESTPQIYSTAGAAAAGLSNYNQAGVAGGGHVGYNWQINQIVLGIEGDVEASNFQGTGSFGAVPYSLHTEINVQGSARGRLGYAWDRLLVYATGGAAFAQLENKYSATAFGLDDYKTGRAGWTVGGGFEYFFRPNWSMRAEYRYTDLGNTSDILANSSRGTLGARVHQTFNIARFGVSYHFSMFAPPAPLVAKY